MNLSFNQRLAALLMLLIAVALALVLVSAPPTEWNRARILGEYVESRGLLGVLIFLVLGAFATSIGLPRQLFAFAAGLSFGVTAGTLLSSMAAIAGCAITFYGARYWLSARVHSKYPKAVNGLNNLLRTDVFLKVIVLRLQPLGTNLITNLCAGVSHVSAKQFLMSSWLGYLPQMIIFALLGAGVRVGSNAYLVYSVSMLFLSFAIGLWLYKRTIAADANSLKH